ncbi:MAG TPA: DUF4214 domain-containing protein [Acidimicrobiales bacterium]|nr:DUF4214 domain-containing protein [Acidimicrobiales bacterium]
MLLAVVLVAGALLPGVGSGPAGAAPDEEGCFVQRGHQVFLDRDATASEIAGWTALFDAAVPRSRLPEALATSDEWLSVEVTALYQQALDRNPDEAGRIYWIDRLRRGAMVTRIGSQIYGSDEFYARAGGTDDGFVTDLYARILHRAPDAAGLEFWRPQVLTRGRPRVAADFLASSESRRDRVTRLYNEVLGRAPDAEGLAFWAEQLRTVNDVRLAVQLASSGEFFTRAQVGCELPPPGVVTFTGHGWGHGRGMGQYGALGYAIDHGWSGTQILNHFYGGTSTATRPTNVNQRVYLVASRGQELVVQQGAGVLRVDGYGADVAAVRIARLGADRFQVWTGPGCSGPWASRGERLASEVAVHSRLAQGDDASLMLQRCTGASARYYRGNLRAVDTTVGGGRTIVTVNEVDTESMLRSVVPAEMPASWADLAGGAGAAALRVQAVAARSYLLAGDTRWTDGGVAWATSCDTTQCQAYAGYGSRSSIGGAVTRSEDSRSDAAVAATARQVRQRSGGAVARTEFSSSTGGWTAGGDFPAVIDEGDDTSRNSRHTWTVDLEASAVESAFDGRQGHDVGAFLGFDSYVRNGLGDQGGRVLSVRARFTGENVTLTGDQVRSLLGLNSNWFATP